MSDVRLTPLAKQSPAGMASYDAPRTMKRRGITVLSPVTTTAPVTYDQVPIQEGYPVYWDQPDFSMKKLRPRYDGQSHLIPKGPGLPRRKGR